jgi:hypothetical protein
LSERRVSATINLVPGKSLKSIRVQCLAETLFADHRPKCKLIPSCLIPWKNAGLEESNEACSVCRNPRHIFIVLVFLRILPPHTGVVEVEAA